MSKDVHNLAQSKTSASNFNFRSLYGTKPITRLAPYVLILSSVDATYNVPIGGKQSLQVRQFSEEKHERSSIIEQLWANPVKVENFKPLTREEIYER
ncbi:MAG: hypothetical protein AB7P14_12520 [Blastocatellales bacterium]